jgi:hypothetical protein
MNLISKTPIVLQDWRDGAIEGYVQIEINDFKEDNLERVRFEVVDKLIRNKDTNQETSTTLHNLEGAEMRRVYYKTYDEFDTERAYLKSLFESDLSGIKLTNYLITKGSLKQLEQVPIYKLEFEERIPVELIPAN